jgi:DNA-binding IclR family transcriptional regulator
MITECSIIEHVIRTTNETVTPSQTLSRGLSILEAVALADAPLSVTEIAESVTVHRSIAYRLIRTLEGHHLIERDEAGNYRPAAGLAVLARSVRLDLRTAAAPELRKLADELGMTAFVVVRDGTDAITVESAEPTSSNVHVVYRPGARHPIDRGAPGLALLLSQPPQPNERAELRKAREHGWARSTGEVLPGMTAIAAPVGNVGAVAVLWMSGHEVSEIDVAARVMATAKRIGATLH